MSNETMTGLFEELIEDQKQLELNAELADRLAAETSPCLEFNAAGEAELMNEIIISNQVNDALAALVKAETEIENVDFNNAIDAEAFESVLAINTFGIYAKADDKEEGKSGKMSKIKDGIKRAIEIVKKVIANLQRRFTLWIKNSLDLSNKRIASAEAQIKRAEATQFKPLNKFDMKIKLNGPMGILVDRKNKKFLTTMDILKFGTEVADIQFDTLAKGFIGAMKTSLAADKEFPQVTRLVIDKALKGSTYKEEGKTARIALVPDMGPAIEIAGLSERTGKLSFKVVSPNAGQNLVGLSMDQRDTVNGLHAAIVMFMKSEELDKNDISKEGDAIIKMAEKEDADTAKIQAISTEMTNYVAFTFALNTYFTKVGLAIMDYSVKCINLNK